MLTALGADLRQLRGDAGLSLSEVAQASGVSVAHLSEVERGMTEPSLRLIHHVAAVLGTEPSVRLYPASRPLIRDHIQSAIADELIRLATGNWRILPEVVVRRPHRGYIDLVLHHLIRRIVVPTEIHSLLGTIELLLRRASDKAESLPSADFWPFASADGGLLVSRLLVVRSTRANREIARRYRHLLAAAYPHRANEIYQSLVEPSIAWPGPGMLWAAVEHDRARILDRPPRGVSLGR
jgi:transcriptional regulator with XRE-family HTH domain